MIVSKNLDMTYCINLYVAPTIRGLTKSQEINFNNFVTCYQYWKLFLYSIALDNDLALIKQLI